MKRTIHDHGGRTARYGGTGAAVLSALAGLGLVAGCGSGPAPAPPAPPAPIVSVAPPVAPTTTPTSAPVTTPAPPPEALPAAADGTNLSACRDRRCEVEITGPTSIPVTGSAIRRWRVTPQGPDVVAVDIVSGDGVDSQSGTGPNAAISMTSSDSDGASTGTVGGPGATVTTGGVVMRLVGCDGSRAVLAFTPA